MLLFTIIYFYSAINSTVYVPENAVIVKEFFPYIPRTEEARQIVNLFVERKTKRKKDTNNAEDKRLNPVIAIPGSPGIGKSAFLKNFPTSPEYRAYEEDVPSIVTPFSFNTK